MKKVEKDNNFITLKEAAGYCRYSPEYLNLRIRQGKLKAVKFGRNWMTKKRWLKDYIARVEEYAAVYPKEREIKKVLVSEPASLKKSDEYRKLSLVKFSKERLLNFQFGFVFSAVLVLLIFITIFSFGIAKERVSLQNLPLDFFFYADIISEAGDIVVKGTAVSVQNIILAKGQGGAGDILRNIEYTFKEYGRWITGKIFAFIRGLKNLPQKFAQRFKSISKLWKEPEEIPEEKEGMVVIPSTEKDEAIKEKIKLSFSDKVRVEPTDESSGIIIPVFKDREGDKYMYVLVPVK